MSEVLLTVLLPMQTLTEWITAQSNSAASAVKTLFVLAITIFAGIRFLKSGGAIAALVGMMLTGGIAYWLVIGNGMAFLGNLMKTQAG